MTNHYERARREWMAFDDGQTTARKMRAKLGRRSPRTLIKRCARQLKRVAS